MRLTLVNLMGGAALACCAAACNGTIGATGTGGSPGFGGSSNPGGGGNTGNSAGGGNTGNSGTTGAGGDGTGIGKPGELDLAGNPLYLRMVRLTNEQWAHATQDVLKLPTAPGLESGFESPVAGTTDFTNNELVLGVTDRSWSDFQESAEALAKLATDTDAALMRVYAGTDPSGFISALGRRVYRRPLTTAEVASYMTVYTTGTTSTGTKSTFAKGAELVITAMLQSPHFLYRMELAPPSAALSGYEMAAKLSLWLRGTTPSDALLDSVATGKLDTADGAATLAQTMLGEATAATVMQHFHSEMLHFDRYSTISKLNVPSYKESLNEEFMKASTMFFDKVFTSGQGLRQILTTTSGFVGPGMAALYGVQASGTSYVERDLGAKRVGYFSQLPYLALYGLNEEQDSIRRGATLNLDVLCAPLGAPSSVIPPVPELKAGQTNRQRITTLTGGCGMACHNEMINPLGFAFEHFDGMGKYRETEGNNLAIDSSGSYAMVDGVKSFTDNVSLMQVMADSVQAHQCYARKLSSFALQRDIVLKDKPMVEALAATSKATGGSIKQVIVDLVKNSAFRTRVGGVQ